MNAAAREIAIYLREATDISTKHLSTDGLAFVVRDLKDYLDKKLNQATTFDAILREAETR